MVDEDDKPEIREAFSGRFADYELGEWDHLYKVEVFHRAEDAEEGVHTTVEGGVVTQDGDMRRNSSSRRGSVALHFWSETRAAPWDKFVMCIFQHKGQEYVKFMSEVDYILTRGGTRGY
jgi:hypothetical protein